MPATGFVTHPRCLQHDPGPGHPERSARLRAILERFEGSGLFAELDVLEPRRALPEELELVHGREHVHAVRESCERAPTSLDGDTSVSRESWDAALLAAGGVLQACERVLEGRWQNAFCAVRPPGHHAEFDRAMGFCLFNNIALAAAWLVHERGLERVAILDWDVHHGNGTQHLFEKSARVFYASLHQWPLYPGTGARDERGIGEGRGTTLNCPMSPGTTDADWIGALESTVLPELEAYRPEFVLVSAGFDAHRLDPLAGVDLTEEGFRALSARVLELARASAGGKLVSVLEGGYHLEALASSAQVHVEELVGAGGTN